MDEDLDLVEREAIAGGRACIAFDQTDGGIVCVVAAFEAAARAGRFVANSRSVKVPPISTDRRTRLGRAMRTG